MTTSRRYTIKVGGTLPESLISALADFDITGCDDSTVLTGNVADSAALYGLLARFEALGVRLLSVHSTTERSEAS